MYNVISKCSTCTCLCMRRIILDLCLLSSWIKVVSEPSLCDLCLYMWSQSGFMLDEALGWRIRAERVYLYFDAFRRQQRYSSYPPSAGEMRSLLNL